MRLSDHELDAYHGWRTAYVAGCRDALAKLEAAIAAGFADDAPGARPELFSSLTAARKLEYAQRAADAYRTAIADNA